MKWYKDPILGGLLLATVNSWLLALTGVLLAIFVSPGAANMAVGAGIAATVFTVITFAAAVTFRKK